MFEQIGTAHRPPVPKVARLSRKARNSDRDTYPPTTTFSAHADLKAVNAGNPGAFWGETPVTPPDSRWKF